VEQGIVFKDDRIRPEMKKMSFWLSIIFILLSHVYTLLLAADVARISLPINFSNLFFILLDNFLFYDFLFIPLAIIFLILSIINRKEAKLSPIQRLLQIIGIISLAFPAYLILSLK